MIEELKKAWELRQRIRKRRKQEDKSRRSSPATAAVPELGDRGRNERREEEGEATSACTIKATSASEDTPPDRGEDDDDLSDSPEGRPHGDQEEEDVIDMQWPWGPQVKAGPQTGRTARGTLHRGLMSPRGNLHAKLPLVGNEAQ